MSTHATQMKQRELKNPNKAKVSDQGYICLPKLAKRESGWMGIFCIYTLGEPLEEEKIGKTWDFVPKRGGVSPNPNFLSKLTKT